jgi:hypothetical protein
MHNTIFYKILLIISVYWFSIQAKSVNAQAYPWPKQSQYESIPDSFKSYPLVKLLEKRVYDLSFSPSIEDLKIYYTIHRKFHVKSTLAIDAALTMISGHVRNSEPVAFKCRIIKPDGKNINFDIYGKPFTDYREIATGIKDLSFKVKVGDQIEMYNTSIIKGLFSVIEWQPEDRIPIKKLIVQAIAPKYMSFKVKSYNGFPEVIETVVGNDHYYNAEMVNMDPAGFDELYSNYNKTAPRVLMQIIGYDDKKVVINNWVKSAEKWIEWIEVKEEKQINAVRSFLKTLHLDTCSSDSSKIKLIEHHIKSTLSFNSKNSYLPMDSLLKVKKCNQYSMLQLFATCLKLEKITFTAVGIGDNNQNTFDPLFESLSSISAILFYIPSCNSFINPISMQTRYPFIQSYYTGKGVCLFECTDKYKVAVNVKEIPMLPYSENVDSLYYQITFDSSMNRPFIITERYYKGYEAFFRKKVYWNYNKNKALNTFNDLYPELSSRDNSFQTLMVSNTDVTSLSKADAMTILASFRTPRFAVGDSTTCTLHIGNLLGQKDYMADNYKRQTDIEMNYPREWYRSIKIEIPEGYTIKDIDKLNANIVKDDIQCGFKAQYTLQGNMLAIEVREWYGKASWPKTDIASFRSVINTAARYYRTKLIIEKK